MRKRKILLHAAFWMAYILPDVFYLITDGLPPDHSQPKYYLTSISILTIAVSVFYILTEWLLPLCIKLKGWHRLFWLNIPLLWIVASYVNMETERIILQSLNVPITQPQHFQDYLAGMFWFMVIAISLTFSQLWYENQLKIRDIENLSVRAELEYLRYRVNPHFLFNALNSLYALALDKSEKTPQIVLRLAHLMRYMLLDENKEVPLKLELEYLENYLELERIRLNNSNNIIMDVEGDIDNLVIMPMLLLPFVENGFKHGLIDSLKDGYLEIKVKVVNKEIFFYVENSINPKFYATTENKLQSTGLGLANVRRRLDLLYGKENYNLETVQEPFKYTINLCLKLN